MGHHSDEALRILVDQLVALVPDREGELVAEGVEQVHDHAVARGLVDDGGDLLG